MAAAEKIKRYDSLLPNLVEVATWWLLLTLLVEQWRPGFFAGYINFTWTFIAYFLIVATSLILDAERRVATPWLVILTLIAIILTTSASWPAAIIMGVIIGLVSLLV